ncbi:hypothetical protein [Bacillus thuringiensis]|nr:hypothetical protein [Bacillus thuringiensis]
MGKIKRVGTGINKEKGLTGPVAVAAALDEEMKIFHETRVQNILKRN